MSLPRYPEYKPSGVEWLGEVPEHWDVIQFKQFVDIQNGADHKHVEQAEGYPVIGSGGVFTYASDFLYDGESVLLGRKGTIDKPLHISGRFWTVDTMYWSKISPDVSGRFTYYTALTIPFDFYSTSTALPSMTKSALNSHRVACPPLAEQTKIAAFLDRETAKIDELVAEQRRLMELLKEKRQAVISHVVTKGLNPDAPMKSSGVEWLGDVPEHWDKVQVGRVCKQVSDGPHFSPSYVDDGVMFLSARNVSVEAWHLDDAKFVSEVDYLEFCKRVIPEKGDILYTKGGTTGIARVVDLEDRFQVWVHIAVLKLHHDMVNPYFMAYALNSIGCYEQSQLYTRGATNQDLGLTRMTKIWFALPTLNEQLEISDFLHHETNRIDLKWTLESRH
jgi:type I restriction enzyme, S subunit